MCLVIDNPVWPIADEWRRARKTHRCDECYREIEVGERYQYTFQVYEGSPETWRMCVHCRATITLGARLASCPESWYWGAVWEDDEACGFVADILEHDLPRVDRLRMLRCVAGKRRRWRWHDGTLMAAPDPGLFQAHTV